MRPTLDSKQLRELKNRLAEAGRSLTKPVLSKMVKTALQPMLQIARDEVPVGKRRFRGSNVRTAKSGKLKRDGTYDQGGAMKRSLRTRIVDGRGDEAIRGLVGVDKRRGHVGWRTPFVTRPNRRHPTTNDFLRRTEQRGIPLVIAELAPSARAVVEQVLNSKRG